LDRLENSTTVPLSGQTGSIAKDVEDLRGYLALGQLATIVGLQDNAVHLVAADDHHMAILVVHTLSRRQELGVLLNTWSTAGAQESIVLSHAQGLILLPGSSPLQRQLPTVQHLAVAQDPVQQPGGEVGHVVDRLKATWREHHAWIRVDRQGDANVHVHFVEPVVIGLLRNNLNCLTFSNTVFDTEDFLKCGPSWSLLKYK